VVGVRAAVEPGVRVAVAQGMVRAGLAAQEAAAAQSHAA
jgi:hypothetical protein